MNYNFKVYLKIRLLSLKFKINLILAFNIFLVDYLSKGTSCLITLKMSFHRKYINMYQTTAVLKVKITVLPGFLLFLILNFYISFPPLKLHKCLKEYFNITSS